MLILVRHGRTAHNAEHRLQGRVDVGLDEVGLRQAAALASVDAVAGAHRVVTSPLARARDTASALGGPVTVDPRWIEIDYGIYDGVPVGEVPAQVWTRWRQDVAWAPEGGESLAAVGRRVRAACEELAAEAADSNVVVVSHVSPIKAAVAWALDAGDEVVFHLHLDTGSLCRVATGDGGPVLLSYNEVHHRPSG
jgi:broad specificity phosphatase PhoE